MTGKIHLKPLLGLRFILEFAGLQRTLRLLLAILLSSLLDLIGIAVIFPYLHAVTDIKVQLALIEGMPHPLDQLLPRTFLIGISLLLLITYVIKSICQMLLTRYQSQQLANLTTQLTDDTVSHLLHTRYGVFLKLAGSDVGSTVFAGPIHGALVYKAILQIASELTFIIALFAAFLFISPLPTLIGLSLLILVGLLLYFIVIRHTARLGRRQSEAENKRYRLIFSMISAFREIKVMGLPSLFESFNREVSTELEQVAWRYNFNHSLPLTIIEAVVLMSIVGGVIGVVAVGIDIAQILPALGLVDVAAVRLVPAVARLFMALNSLRFYNESVKRIQGMRTELIHARHERVQDAITFSRDLVLDRVSFSHGDKLILNDISLTIKVGKSYGIVGPSGSGKSTLLDVISGLQPTNNGQFKCDGASFNPYSSQSMLSLIGYVPQDITLIDESLAFNITFEHYPDLERLANVIRMSNLQALVDGLPNGCDESVGENGSRISGGQRQRVGLARALYRQPKILVLDEATSALDPITERQIANELETLKGHVTLLTVAHRIAAIQNCDEILVLNHGHIVARGSHETLLEGCALYRDLYLSQQHSNSSVAGNE